MVLFDAHTFKLLGNLFDHHRAQLLAMALVYGYWGGGRC